MLDDISKTLLFCSNDVSSFLALVKWYSFKDNCLYFSSSLAFEEVIIFSVSLICLFKIAVVSK